MNFGQNQFFYDSAEGLLTATILIVFEYAEKNKRHIISVFKLIQNLLVPTGNRSNEFKVLIESLPENHKARWFAGAALNTSDQSMQSVISTALARLNAFIDSELEQLPMNFNTFYDLDAFCNNLENKFIDNSISDLMSHYKIKQKKINKSIAERIVVRMFGEQSKNKWHRAF